MENLTVKHGIQLIVLALRFHRIQLGSRPEAQDLIPSISEHLSNLGRLDDRYQDAQEASQAATARSIVLQMELNEALRAAESFTLAQVRRKKDAPLYQEFFGKRSLSEMRGQGLADRLQSAQVLAGRMKQEAFATVRQELEQAIAALQAAQQGREPLDRAAADAAVDLNQALERACQQYNGNYHTLGTRFPGQKALIESFFRTLRKEKRPTAKSSSGAAGTVPDSV